MENRNSKLEKNLKYEKFRLCDAVTLSIGPTFWNKDDEADLLIRNQFGTVYSRYFKRTFGMHTIRSVIDKAFQMDSTLTALQEAKKEIEYAKSVGYGNYSFPLAKPIFENMILESQNFPNTPRESIWICSAEKQNSYTFRVTFLSESFSVTSFTENSGTLIPDVNFYNYAFEFDLLKNGTVVLIDSELKSQDGKITYSEFHMVDYMLLKSFFFERIYCILKLLSILNCKNVEVLKTNYTPKVRDVKDREPKNSYYVLAIKDIKFYTEKGNQKSNIDHRLHLCRGHFKTYTADKPLLGKFTGTYWWQPHMRGKKELGEVKKDYSYNELGVPYFETSENKAKGEKVE